MAMSDKIKGIKEDFKEAKRQGMIGNYDSTLEIYNKIVNDLQDVNEPEMQSFVVEAIYLKGRIYFRKKNLDKLRDEITKLTDYVKKTGFKMGEGRVFYLQCREAIIQKNFPLALKLADKCLDSGKNVKITHPRAEKFAKAIIASSHHLFGLIHFYTGDLDSAIDHNLKSMEISERINDIYSVSASYNNTANCFALKGDHRKAIGYYEKSRALSERINDIDGITLSLSNMAIEYRYIGDYDRALQYNMDALEIRKQIGLKKTISTTLHNIGCLYHDLGEFELAEDHFKEALELAQNLNLVDIIAVILGDYAKLLQSKGRNKEAKQMFEESLDYYEKSGVEVDLVDKLCSYSKLLVSMDNVDDAVDVLNRSTELSAKHGSSREKLNCLLVESIIEKYNENYGIARNLLYDILEEAKEIQYFDIHVMACLLLAESAVQKFQRNQLEKNYQSAMVYIEEAETLSEQARIYPKLIQTLIIKSNLYTANLDFGRALRTLEKASNICKEKNLKTLAVMVIESQNRITDRQMLSEQVSSSSLSQLKRIATNDVLNLINRDGIRYQEIIREFNERDIYISVFKHGKKGPIVVETDDLPFKNPREVLLSIGVFYSMAIGQGNRHHQGLFGPLPLADASHDWLSLVYAKTITDEEQTDQRMKGKSYCLFCLFYRIKFAPLFYERGSITGVFEKNLMNLEGIGSLTCDNLLNLKKDLFEAVSS